MPELAERARRTNFSASMSVAMRARALRAEGREIISLAIGDPDFPAPPHAIAAAKAAADRGRTSYPPLDGLPELKEAVRRKFLRDQGVDYAANEVMVANGGKQVLMNAFFATIDPGDEVVIPTPAWVAYADMAAVVGGVPRLVPCPENNGFLPRIEDLEAAIGPRTRWLLLNFPNNPTGAVAPPELLAEIGRMLERHPHVWLLTDDMYEHLCFAPGGYRSIAACAPQLRERTLVVSGISKTYSMTGWRVGFAGGPAALIRAMCVMQGHQTAGVNVIAQAAAVAALDGPQEIVAERAAIYRERRDIVVAALNAAGLRCHTPDGAFYAYPSVAGMLGRTTPEGRRIETDADFAMALLEEAGVATVSGGAFGMSPFIRISTATDTDSLRAACTRIAAFCASLR